MIHSMEIIVYLFLTKLQKDKCDPGHGNNELAAWLLPFHPYRMLSRDMDGGGA